MPCLALRCGSVSCCAVLYFEHTAVPGVYVLYIPFCLLVIHLIYLCRSPFIAPHANYTCNADQNVTPPTSTQHSTDRAICSAQAALGIIKTLFAPKHGSLLSAPLTCLVAFFLAQALRAVQPPAERSPCSTHYLRYRMCYVFPWRAAYGAARSAIHACL